jgi:small subunit ribosomal protein S21
MLTGHTYFSMTALRQLFKTHNMGVRIRLHDREPIGLALRRLRKLQDRHGYNADLRKHLYFVKPSVLRRWKQFEALRNRRHHSWLGQLRARGWCALAWNDHDEDDLEE